MLKKLREIHSWMMDPANGDLAVGVVMLIVAGFLLGFSVVQ